ncbi:hypothetical protein VI817_002736 [Penicillium citrinum]|uniref:Uncharacterized protein n=1 Tax=Penicillium hetheringtonii TaxID=911720 RepID=A0AAD6DRT8_9EURO|nr:hypothetical protein N7450_004609 [Penicillium hetheringtonii]KAK5800524.1 hypothetical protein VI817_002736 [Penicillium citrinum]
MAKNQDTPPPRDHFARTIFAMRIEDTLRRIDEVQPILVDISETMRYDEAADMLHAIANEIQATRNVMYDPNASPSPADINMANIMVDQLRHLAEYLQLHIDSGIHVSTKLHDLVREIRNNPEFGNPPPPTKGRFPID